MVQQLLERLIDMGLQVYANTPVTEISSSRDEKDYWTAHTPRGPVRARKIVYCTNAYTPALLPRYKDKIIPVRGICSHISSSAGKNSPHLPNTYSLRFDKQQYDYLIPRADGSIIVGGARKAFWHIKESWFGNSNDNELVEGGREYFDGYMQKYFRGWENSDAKLEKVWTGSTSSSSLLPNLDSELTFACPVVMGYSSDFVPHLGQVPNTPSQFILAGFSGHGMPQILLASRGIASMVTEDIPYEQTGLPTVFKTTNERLDSTKNELEEGFKNIWEPKAKPGL
jgi:glycine/D-amino acid oxidase-like deaminating enzyme